MSELDLVKKRRRGDGALLLSLRAAASLLGVSRNTTLKALIANGQLRTVPRNGGIAVPRAEVERLARVGFDTSPKPRRIPRHRLRDAAPSRYESSDPSTWKLRI